MILTYFEKVLIDILLEGYENSPEKRVFPLFPLFWRVPLMPELAVVLEKSGHREGSSERY